ncbi:MAG: DUF2079 domain-containing protein [Actinomycetes bacterium]|nr:DUF2079 domain-containing protein [Actinomycetes bacterium]MDX5380116.1 DUF2079 domain-containing protein [Actinomycetes bacterium]MDX5398719.1 DUF2079 domain-containing protein [Actinomycetes bacterium]MDX5449826.1 DUF2079 domain-containing protein [Actinomycetes bacterium]
MTFEPTAAHPARRGGRRGARVGPRTVAAGVVVLATTLHALFSWQQWTALIVPSWDLAIFSQLAKAYSRLEAPIVPIKGEGFNLLGDHFHPILVLLGPVWAVWPSGLALLMVQAVLLGASAWPLTRLAVEWPGARWGTVFGLGYALVWGLQAAVAAPFHEIAVAVPLLAFALAAFLRERPVAAALWAAPLVFVKEDLGVTVALLGALIAWRFPGPRARWTGAALAAWGVAWVVLAVGVILPALNPGGEYDYAERLIGLASILTPVTKWVTALMLVTTAGVVGVRSPLFLLVLPTLAWRFAGDVEQYWGWEWHYNAVLMPVVLAALLDGLRRRRTAGVSSPPPATIPPTTTPDRRARASRPARAATDRGPRASWPAQWAANRGPRASWPAQWAANRGPRASWPARGALAVAVATTLVLGPALPYATLLRPETWVRTWRWEPAQRVIAAIPEGAVVESDLTLLAYLVPTAEVHWVGTESSVPDFVVVDSYSAAWGGNPPADPTAWATDRWGVTFETLLDDGGFTLARRAPG